MKIEHEVKVSYQGVLVLLPLPLDCCHRIFVVCGTHIYEILEYIAKMSSYLQRKYKY